MATPWSEVVQKPEYQALSPELKEAARQQYFDQVVTTQISDPALVPVAKQQFDAQTSPSASPFGKGVDKAVKQAQAEDSQPMSLGQQAGRAFLRSGKALSEGIGSAMDVVTAPIAYGLNKVLPANYQIPTNAQAVDQSFQRITGSDMAPQTSAERYADAITRGVGGVATGVGAGGALAGTAPRLAQMLSAAPGAQLAAGASGSTTAQAAKDAGVGPTGQLLAGLGGALIPGGTAAAVRLANNIAVQPFTQAGQRALTANYLGNVAGGAPVSVTPSAVPGVAPTLAEAAGNPGIAQLQRALQNQPGNVADFASLAASNNAARHAYLTNQLGTPESIADLTAQRAATTRPLYNLAANMDAESRAIQQGSAGVAQQQGLVMPGGRASASNAASAISNAVPDQVKPLMNRPAFQQAVKDAQQLLAERGKPDMNPLTSVEGLQAIKTSLDNAINKAPTNAAATFDVNAVKNTRSQLIKALQDISPVQREADTRFAQLSAPINAQELGQEVVRRGSGNLIDPTTGLPSLQPNAFAGAINRGDAIAQSVTGQKNAALADVMSPEQMGALQNVRGDLERVAYAQNAGRAPGSNTGQNILSANALDNIAQAVGMPGLANTSLAKAVLTPLDKIYNLFGVQDALKGTLTRVLLNPTSAEAADVLSQIPAAQRRQIQARATPYLNVVRQAQLSAAQQQQPQSSASSP